MYSVSGWIWLMTSAFHPCTFSLSVFFFFFPSHNFWLFSLFRNITFTYLVWIWQKLFLPTYFCYYLWTLLHFLVLFMSLTILFQLTFTFIYNVFSKKYGASTNYWDNWSLKCLKERIACCEHLMPFPVLFQGLLISPILDCLSAQFWKFLKLCSQFDTQI